MQTIGVRQHSRCKIRALVIILLSADFLDTNLFRGGFFVDHLVCSRILPQVIIIILLMALSCISTLVVFNYGGFMANLPHQSLCILNLSIWGGIITFPDVAFFWGNFKPSVD